MLFFLDQVDLIPFKWTNLQANLKQERGGGGEEKQVGTTFYNLLLKVYSVPPPTRFKKQTPRLKWT